MVNAASGKSISLEALLNRVTKYVQARTFSDEAPLRAEVFSLEQLARHAWDGDWYLRAWFDDGTPLGSAVNVECRIDSIAQSWGVISAAAEAGRATQAMAAVDRYLVRRDDGLVLLFTPPFHSSKLDPGYIKGYVPGVRENGGQYTHGALWAAMAFAALGDRVEAIEINPLRVLPVGCIGLDALVVASGTHHG